MLKKLDEILDYKLLSLQTFQLTVMNVLTILIIFITTFLILKLIKRALLSPKKNTTKDRKATYYALFQFIRYFSWVIAISICFGSLGIKMNNLTTIMGALMVGIGFGMQELFINFISGIILMVEGSLKVGDVLEIDGDVIKIKEIGLRTSKGLNRDNIIVIIPNSLITNDKVINWSHQADITRFDISVSVAYDSDMNTVKNLLRESALEIKEVDKDRDITVMLVNFGSDGLDFKLFFYSHDNFRIEKIKSDLRFLVLEKFRANNISIPYPQMDVHMING